MLCFFLLAGALGGCPAQHREIEKSQKRVDLAKNLLSEGQDAAAEKELEKALAYDPRNEEAHNVLGLVFVYRANRNVRLVEIEDCLEGTMAQGLRTEADEFMRKARTHFERAAKMAPDYGEAYQNLGVVAKHFQDWDRCIAEETRALENLARLQSEALARANLAYCYSRKDDQVRAASELLQAMQREPTFCLGAFRLAQVLDKREEYEAALEKIEPFLQTPRECPIQEAQYLGGQLYLRLREYDAAREAFGQCIDMAPKSCIAKSCERASRNIP